MADVAPGDIEVLDRTEDRSTVGRQLAGLLSRGRQTLLGLLSICLVLTGWYVASTQGLVDPLFLPTPLKVFFAIGEVVTSDTFMHDLSISAYEFALGLGLSITLGGVIGILSGWYRPVEHFLHPLIIALNSVPTLALIPLIILIFGIGTLSKIVLVVLSCMVVMLLNTAAGVANVDKQLLRMARSFGASDWQLITTVVLPSVVPFFMTGVRISVGRAVVAVVVAEIFASVAGLGNILIRAQSTLNMPVMYATVILLTIIGITLTQTAALLERRMQRWKT